MQCQFPEWGWLVEAAGELQGREGSKVRLRELPEAPAAICHSPGMRSFTPVPVSSFQPHWFLNTPWKVPGVSFPQACLCRTLSSLDGQDGIEVGQGVPFMEYQSFSHYSTI